MSDRAPGSWPPELEILGQVLTELPSQLGRSVDGLVGRFVYGLGPGVEDPPAGTAGAVRPERASLPLTEEERRLLVSVDEFLARGTALKAWWERTREADAFAGRFDLARARNEPEESFGFFDRAPVGGRPREVMGNFQEMFYDRPKSAPAGSDAAVAWTRDQLREFVLRYFMRVSDFREPEGYADDGPPPPPPWLAPLSLCPRGEGEGEDGRKGFGFSQLFYKLRESGEVGRFQEEERSAIVDLREIGRRYEWIVLRVEIFDFDVEVEPLGSRGPRLALPLTEESYLVVSADFVVEQEEPEPGVLGRYGLGYAFVKNPRQGLLAYGPGEFEAAIETITFEISTDGEIRVPMVFVSNRPERILTLTFDPVGWGLGLADLATFGMASRLAAPVRAAMKGWPLLGGGVDPVYGAIDLANLATGGLAARRLCISREQLERDFLVKHYVQHYQTVAGSLATWRLIPDWLDEASLPPWVVTGKVR